MNSREESSRNIQEYIKFNHTSVLYTYNMEYEIIQDIKNNEKNLENISNIKELMKYLEDLVCKHFKTDLLKDNGLEKGYDFFNQDDINKNTVNYKKTRSSKDFWTAIIKNLKHNNFLFLVDSYYKEGNSWKNTILEFYNIFVNKFLKNNKKLNKYRINAVFATLDSSDLISVIYSKVESEKMNSHEEYKYLEELNKKHEDKVYEILNVKKIF